MKYLIFISALLFINNTLNSKDIIWSEPVNLSTVNTPADEFAPAWNNYLDQLFYNSNSSGYSKFYYVEIGDSNTFSIPKLVEGGLNQSHNNQSYITFESKDIAYLSTFEQYGGRPYLNILQTRRKKNEWLKPFKADSLMKPYFIGHPAISPDGMSIVFASDMNSEYGDTDLWIASRQENGTWGTLLRITQLKTPGMEITPFFAGNDTLYFASDGQEGPGGYDLFFSVNDKGVWQMPFPITSLNTEFNESDLTLLQDGRVIFASDRPGGRGNLDLYIASPLKDNALNSINYDIDFVVAAQVPAIRINNEINESIFPVSPYFITTQDELFSIPFNDNSKNDLLKPENLQLLSLNTIIERVSKYSKAVLNLWIYTSKEINEKEIKDIVVDRFNLPKEKLSINFAQIPNELADKLPSNSIYLKMHSNDERVFAPLLDYNKISIIPPVLDLSIDARPRVIINSWKCNLIIGTEIDEIVKTGNEFPAKFFLNLKKYENYLKTVDSVLLNLNSKDTLSNDHKFSYTFAVNHTTVKESNIIRINDSNYLLIPLIVVDPNDLFESNEFLYTFRVIAEQSLKKQNIIIKTYSENGYKIANNIKELLTKQLSGGPKKITIEKNTDKNDIPDKKFTNFYFKIFVEQ